MKVLGDWGELASMAKRAVEKRKRANTVVTAGSLKKFKGRRTPGREPKLSDFPNTTAGRELFRAAWSKWKAWKDKK